MHELSVTESILDICLRYAREANAKKINKIFLVIGDLSSYVDDSVQFYWDIIAKGTIAEGATLQFKRIPAEMICLECGDKFKPDADTFACPHCSSIRVKVISGDEFRVDSIEID